MSSIAGSNFDTNSTLQNIGGLLKNTASPQNTMMAQIITSSLQQGSEMESAVRSTAMQDMGKGLRVDTQA